MSAKIPAYNVPELAQYDFNSADVIDAYATLGSFVRGDGEGNAIAASMREISIQIGLFTPTIIVSGGIQGGQYDLCFDINADGQPIPTVASSVFINVAAEATELTMSAPASGAIAPLPAVSGQDGTIIRITSTTAKAHVITFPAGALNGGADTTITYSGHIGDSVTLQAKGGTWLAIVKTGVVLA
jgi:hypothetical protein